MPQNQQRPLLYLITSGRTTVQTNQQTKDFSAVLRLVEAAVAAKIDLVQLREKQLNAGVLYDLTARAADITRGSETRLLVNERADVASAGGADGVHLTSHSLPAAAVRRSFGQDFLIGVSTHSAQEAESAKNDGADFVVFGPVFETPSKTHFGNPKGVESLAEVAKRVSPFPVLALGGVGLDRVLDCLHAGAQGVAAIRMFDDPEELRRIVNAIRKIE